MKKVLVLLILMSFPQIIYSSASDTISDKFTRADSIRGTIFPEREWWNVLRYDITVKPDFEAKSISGNNNLIYRVEKENHPRIMQIDLQSPLTIDSIIFNGSSSLDFKQFGNAWYVSVPEQSKNSENSVLIYYHGIPIEAKNPPWDGGWVWKKDTLGNPWVSAACQVLGASAWYPCKDHQSDEPDNGASLTMIVPDTLTGVGNGRLKSIHENGDGTKSFKWEVINPINNYNIIPYIGKYTNFTDTYNGEKGLLDIDIWVLHHNLEKAKAHSLPEVIRMLEAFEHWFGPYPFYEDSYKLIDAPYAGMEHQSAIAYGNKYLKGYWGRNLSGTQWGMKWDYMIVHESGHEWFGNSITTNDIADLWVHEGITNYSEVLFTEYWYGKEAGDEYAFGIRKNIRNKFPMMRGYYGVNYEAGGDIYPKGANLMHTIRHSLDDDDKFRNILRGLNKTFYHKTVTSTEIENYINQYSGFNFEKVFDQYLRTIQIPVFKYYFTEENNSLSVKYKYSDCIKGFNLPIVLKDKNTSLKLYPTDKWKSKKISLKEKKLIDNDLIKKKYYLNVLDVRR